MEMLVDTVGGQTQTVTEDPHKDFRKLVYAIESNDFTRYSVESRLRVMANVLIKAYSDATGYTKGDAVRHMWDKVEQSEECE